MQLWLESEESSDFSLRADRVWKSSDHDVAEVHLDDFHGQDEAISLVGMIDWILVRCSDWTMIPLENIVAAAAGSGTRIAAAIKIIGIAVDIIPTPKPAIIFVAAPVEEF